MSRGGLLRASRDLAARYGRMTVEDVVQIGQVFRQVARRQCSDALVALRAQRGRSIGRAGRG